MRSLNGNFNKIFFRCRTLFKIADTLVDQLSDGLSSPQLLETSRWQAFFKMATNLMEHLGLRNNLVGDTSMKIGMSHLKG